ncbi:MAG: integrin alpha, partial [Myxococcota bacterium]|nr:integrin alpha [Myxococcota bacterium]
PGADLSTGPGLGAALAPLGDLNGDGVHDLAASAYAPGTPPGTVWILYLNPDGTVKDSREISGPAQSLGADATVDDSFGASLANIGDRDGGGVPSLAVGVPDEPFYGGLWLLDLAGDCHTCGNGELGQPEACGNSLDDDCDGITDEGACDCPCGQVTSPDGGCTTDGDYIPAVSASVQGGDWSDGATWDTGEPPGACHRVEVHHDVSLWVDTAVGRSPGAFVYDAAPPPPAPEIPTYWNYCWSPFLIETLPYDHSGDTSLGSYHNDINVNESDYCPNQMSSSNAATSEAVYAFVAPASGNFLVTVESESDLMIAALSSCDPDEAVCLGGTDDGTGGQAEQLSLSLVQDQVLFIV